jgi:hypothetical protein
MKHMISTPVIDVMESIPYEQRALDFLGGV